MSHYKSQTMTQVGVLTFGAMLQGSDGFAALVFDG